MKTRLAVAMVAGVALVVGVNAVCTDRSPAIPKCAEDDIIVGTGNYSNGQWEGYTCSHPDILQRSN